MLLEEWHNELIYKRMMKSFTNGITRGFILYTLYKEPMHGYEIVNRVNKCFENPIKRGLIKKVPSSKIYPYLINMEISGLISSKNSFNEKTNKNIKYYYITEKGVKLLKERKKLQTQMTNNEYFNEFIEFMQEK